MTRTWTATLPDPFDVDPDGEVYWWRNDSKRQRRIVLLQERHGGLNASYLGESFEECAEALGGEWLGPITPEDVARADGPTFGAAGSGEHPGPIGWTIHKGTILSSDMSFHPDIAIDGSWSCVYVSHKPREKPSMSNFDIKGEQTAADATVGRKVREGEATVFGVYPHSECRAGAREVDSWMAECQRDLAVGRKLREIRAAHDVTGVYYGDDDALGVTVKVLRFEGKDACYGPPADALERAHAEATGRTCDTSPESMRKAVAAAEAQGGGKVYVKATGKGEAGDGAKTYCRTCGKTGAILTTMSQCFACRDAPAKPGDLDRLADTVASIANTICPACFREYEPAKPDYASMSDEELFTHMDPDAFMEWWRLHARTEHTTLRAALIAFLKASPVPPPSRS